MLQLRSKNDTGNASNIPESARLHGIGIQTELNDVSNPIVKLIFSRRKVTLRTHEEEVQNRQKAAGWDIWSETLKTSPSPAKDWCYLHSI